MFFYSLYNYQSNAYFEPCFFESDAAALRFYCYFFNSMGFPDDIDNFELRCCGYFHSDTGDIDSSTSYVLADFKDFLLKEKDNG